MAVIIRIDVDRPYGRAPLPRHLLSRLSSDLYFPKVAAFGYLAELQTMLGWLNEEKARAYVFFRRCTLPSESILELLDAGGHEVGLHLENSRSFTTFMEEKEDCRASHWTESVRRIQAWFGRREVRISSLFSVRTGRSMSSGPAGCRCGCSWAICKTHHWSPRKTITTLLIFPSAFWLEPHWRDSEKFTVDWLLTQARTRDIVLLVHPENVLAHPALVADFKKLVGTLESRVF